MNGVGCRRSGEECSLVTYKGFILLEMKSLIRIPIINVMECDTIYNLTNVEQELNNFLEITEHFL